MKTHSFTVTINIDATSPADRDATINISSAIVKLFSDAYGPMNVVEHTAEYIVMSGSIRGDFEIIEP